MARDLEIALCSGCEFRPIDPDTRRPVEGGLRVGERPLDDCTAVVIYSTVDPRINSQFALEPSTEVADLSTKALRCVPVAEGLGIGLGDFDTRLKAASKNNTQNCTLVRFLSRERQLPENLLYKFSEQA